MWTVRTGGVREVVPGVRAVSKLWIGLGKKDGTRPNEVVAARTREARVDRGKIGKIEVREIYTSGVHGFCRTGAWGDAVGVPNQPFVAPQAKL